MLSGVRLDVSPGKSLPQPTFRSFCIAPKVHATQETEIIILKQTSAN